MATTSAFRCHDCNMIFNSAPLLHKHRAKFCIGTSPVDHLQLNTDRSQPNPDLSTDLVEELQIYKRSKAESRERQNAQERHLLDSFYTSPRATMPYDFEDFTQMDATPRDVDGRNSQKRHWQQQAYSHSRNLTEVQSKGRALEQQRAEINQKLEDLRTTGSDVTQQLLQQLKEQEDRNQATLAELRQQLMDLQMGRKEPVCVQCEQKNIEQGLSNEPECSCTCSCKHTSPRDQSIDEEYEGLLGGLSSRFNVSQPRSQAMNKQMRPAAHPNSLISEIRKMRQDYIRKGGNNTNILAQMTQMEAEALGLESRQADMKDRRVVRDNNQYRDLNRQIDAFERENHRIQEQLDYSLTGRSNYIPDVSEVEIHQQRQLQRLQQLQQEMELVKQEAQLARLKAELQQPPPKTPQPPPRQHQDRPLQQQQPPQHPYVDAELPALMQPENQFPAHSLLNAAALGPAPYDPNAGFVVFYDFILGLEPGLQSCRLVVGLHNNAGGMGVPRALPTVHCQAEVSSQIHQGSNMALIRARQPVPRCPPAPDMSIVVELQATSVASNRLTTRAWCKFDVFDDQKQVISGCWRLPLRRTPLHPNYTMAKTKTVPQYGRAELFYRVVNFADADSQAMILPDQQHSMQYAPPPEHEEDLHDDSSSTGAPSAYTTHATPTQFPMAHNLAPLSQSPNPVLQPSPRHRDPGDPDFSTIGFQVDRVKNGENGEGKVRITAYHARTGKVVQQQTSHPVTCSTTAVFSSYRHNYHIFGQQEAMFTNVCMKPDMVAIVKFYLRHRLDRGEEISDSHAVYDEETLVAWTFLPLMLPAHPGQTPVGRYMRHPQDLQGLMVNTGTHVLPLFKPPVADLHQVSLIDHYVTEKFPRYGKANVKLHVFQGQPRPGSLTPSDSSEDEEENLPPMAWIAHDRDIPPTEPFNATDGFDLYIDGCRHLPDCVTITRVAGRMLDRNYENAGKDIHAHPTLDCDIYNPVYNQRLEYREPNMAPSATLLFKIYTIDRFKHVLMVVGYATLNVFVENGSEKQPSTDQGGIQISLNEGSHQLCLYQGGPDGTQPLTEGVLREAGHLRVPCATLLVRLVKAPIGPQGRPLEAEKLPQTDWSRMGLWKPRPNYVDKVYYSIKSMPTPGEVKLYHALSRRPKVLTREASLSLADNREAKMLRSDRSVSTFIREKLTKMMDDTPVDVDLNYLTVYTPNDGIKFSLDSAMNLPWSGFTFATFCLNPPGSFYLGMPHAVYDKPVFTHLLDPASSNKAPVWRDGFKHFPGRVYQRHLCVIVHLQELSVNVATENYKYALMDQGWTVVQVFTDKYAHTHIYQLPLIQGAPALNVIKQLTREPAKEWLARNVKSGSIKLLDKASVFVRLCDARREEELPPVVDGESQVPVNLEYLPPLYPRVQLPTDDGRALGNMVPHGKTAEEFFDTIAVKFKSLVFRLYEEGKLQD